MCSDANSHNGTRCSFAFRNHGARFLTVWLTRLCAVLLAPSVIGCSKAQPLPPEPIEAVSPLTETDIRDIARNAAEQAVVRIRREEQNKAKIEQQHRAKAASEEAQLARQAAESTEEQAAIEAVNRSEQAYWLLVPSERLRVDAIRQQIAKEGLARLDHEDIQWAWQGEGQDCLKLELLTAADKQLPAVEADTASLGLTNTGLIEFYCLDPLEQLRRLQWAKRFVEGDESIPEDTIIEFRRDPFLATLVRDYMMRQRKQLR
jgi:hypothetical protein